MTALCPTCGTYFTTLARTGLLRIHANERGRLCAGSGLLPKGEL